MKKFYILLFFFLHLALGNHTALAYEDYKFTRIIGECENSVCTNVKTGNLSYEPATQKEIQALEKSLSNTVTKQSHGVYQLEFWHSHGYKIKYKDLLENQLKYGTISNLQKLESESVDQAIQFYRNEMSLDQHLIFFKRAFIYIFIYTYVLLSLAILYRRLFSSEKKTARLVWVKILITFTYCSLMALIVILASIEYGFLQRIPSSIIIVILGANFFIIGHEFYIYEAILLTELFVLLSMTINFLYKKYRIA